MNATDSAHSDAPLLKMVRIISPHEFALFLTRTLAAKNGEDERQEALLYAGRGITLIGLKHWRGVKLIQEVELLSGLHWTTVTRYKRGRKLTDGDLFAAATDARPDLNRSLDWRSSSPVGPDPRPFRFGWSHLNRANESNLLSRELS